MYLSDMRLSNVEISVAHAAPSVTEIAPKSPLPISYVLTKPGWYGFPAAAPKVSRYRSV